MRQALRGFGGRAHKPRLRRPGPGIGHGRIRFKPRPRKEDRLRQQRLNVCLALLHAAAAGGAEYRRLSPRACLKNVTKYLAPGAIVVFHDSEKAFRNMRYALPRTLEKIRQMGLKCKAIEL